VERNTWLIFLILTALIVAFSSWNVFPQSGEDPASNNVLEDISSKLQEKPVLITFGSESCGACQQQEIVLENVENKYAESIYFVHIDVDEHPRLAGAFGVYSIPDTSIIVMEEEGQYLYMGYGGYVTADRGATRELGPSDVDALSLLLNMSIDYKNIIAAGQENSRGS